ncbi:MAG: RHS repeat domain-containing protein [Bacteroidota bacterium]
MKAQNIFVLFLSLCSIFKTQAQPVNNLLQDVVLPAPNAAALGKYADIPVSHFSGVPSISIPIYTVQEGPLRLPVSLNYHASGLKVAETSSWVGMGWSLNAGGMITRTVLGIPDESPKGMANYRQQIVKEIENPEGKIRRSFFQEVTAGLVDTESDIFSFNFAGASGKFFIDGNKEVQLIPEQDVRVTINWGFSGFTKILGFIVTLPDGTSYHFGNFLRGDETSGIEYTKTLAQEIDNVPYEKTASSWYLLRVESADKRHAIDLHYADETYSYQNLGSCYITRLFCDFEGSSSAVPLENCNGVYDPTIDSWLTKTLVNGKRLSSITTSSGLVSMNLEKGAAREDLDEYTDPYAPNAESAYSLGRIEIREGESCKEWNFKYEYSQPLPGEIASTSRADGKRLILTEIAEQSCDGKERIPPYKFLYKNSVSNALVYSLPSRLSKAVDHWGFYNGRKKNNTLKFNIPRTELEIPDALVGSFDPSLASYGESDRETNPDWVDIGILEKMVYPTGGVKEFVYEPNTYFSREVEVKREELAELNTCGPKGDECCGFNSTCCSPNTSYTHTFRNKEEIDSARVSLNLHIPDYLLELLKENNTGQDEICHDSFEDSDACCANSPFFTIRLQLLDTETNVLVGEVSYNLDARYSSTNHLAKTHLLRDLELWQSLVPNTPYRLELAVNQGVGTASIFIQNSTVEEGTHVAGGVRIKELRTKTDKRQEEYARVKKYSYQQKDSQESSGKLYFQPTYGYLDTGMEEGPRLEFEIPTLSMYFLDYSVVPLGSYQGAHVGYERITEWEEGNGKTVYTFYTEEPELGTNILPNPPVLATPLNGKTHEVLSYKEGSNSPLSSTTSEYDDQSTFSEEFNYKIKNYKVDCYVSGQRLQDEAFFLVKYQQKTFPGYLLKEEHMLDGVSSSTNYSYRTDNRHHFPIKVSTANSDGRNLEERFKYPLDYAEGLSFENGSTLTIDDLIDQYMIGTPIETQQWEGVAGDLRLIEGRIQVYQDFSESNVPLIKPFMIFLLEDNSPILSVNNQVDETDSLYLHLVPEKVSAYYVERASFEYEPTYGSMVEQRLTEGTPTSYIWGSKGNQLLAEVVGQTYENIEGVAIHQLRLKFPMAMVSTYTYEGRTRLSSVMDPNGISIHYDYDALNRLIKSEDFEGNDLQSFWYNYKAH